MLTRQELNRLTFLYKRLKGEHKEYREIIDFFKEKDIFEIAYIYDKNYQPDGDFTKVTDPIRMSYKDFLDEQIEEVPIEEAPIVELPIVEEEDRPPIPRYREGFAPRPSTGGSYTVSNLSKPTCQNYDGTPGTLIVDNEYLYVCVRHNTWKKYKEENW